jgi:imidazolonepropionase-like amidohydrolase
VVLTGGVVHPVSGPPIEPGALWMEEGILRAVGTPAEVAALVSADAEVIDVTGKHVWPGMVDALGFHGLTEVGSVPGTVDLDEAGEMNPNVRAEIAINVSSSHFPVTRANGVLLAAVLPRGGLVSGTAAAIALDGWSVEELVRRSPVGLVAHWPSMREKTGAGAGAAEEKGERPAWEARVARLDEMVEEGRVYYRARTPVESKPPPRAVDVRWESLAPVVSGDVPVWIHASSLAQIRAALDWTERHGLRMVLVDGNHKRSGDAWRCAGELAARDVPVILHTTRLPARRHEPYDTPFTSPGRLHAAGVSIAFASWSSAHARDLPQEAARAAAFGLPREAAIRALTLGAAEILGIDDRYGSLEPGKSATVLVTDGDLLEVRMHVERAWLDGRELDLESRHTRLWKEWSRRPMLEASRPED